MWYFGRCGGQYAILIRNPSSDVRTLSENKTKTKTYKETNLKCEILHKSKKIKLLHMTNMHYARCKGCVGHLFHNTLDAHSVWNI